MSSTAVRRLRRPVYQHVHVGVEIHDIVRRPSTVQSLKGIVSAGLGKSIRYAGQKVGKWRNSATSS
jgi:mitochondrial translocator assembly and maintenance protein 41